MERTGTTDDPQRKARPSCQVEGCNAPHVARGLCRNHYSGEHAKKNRHATKLATPRRCAFCGKPIDPAKLRRGPVSYCSRACKERQRIASGQAAITSRKSYLKTRYGLTPEQVDELAKTGCAICGTTEWMGRHARPHVDHDHATGEVRGLLCHNCNLLIGYAHEDPAVLRSAIAYLAR